MLHYFLRVLLALLLIISMMDITAQKQLMAGKQNKVKAITVFSDESQAGREKNTIWIAVTEVLLVTTEFLSKAKNG